MSHSPRDDGIRRAMLPLRVLGRRIQTSLLAAGGNLLCPLTFVKALLDLSTELCPTPDMWG